MLMLLMGEVICGLLHCSTKQKKRDPFGSLLHNWIVSDFAVFQGTYKLRCGARISLSYHDTTNIVFRQRHRTLVWVCVEQWTVKTRAYCDINIWRWPHTRWMLRRQPVWFVAALLCGCILLHQHSNVLFKNCYQLNVCNWWSVGLGRYAGNHQV